MADPRSTEAAPPDDGHLGSHTLPEDVMAVPEVDRPERAPFLHRDVPPQRSGAGLGVVVWMAVVVVIALLLVWLFWAFY